MSDVSQGGGHAVLKFHNREAFEEWLKTQKREIGVAIAARAVLRVLPLVVVDEENTHLAPLISATLRAVAVARATAAYPAHANQLSAEAAAGDAAVIERDALFTKVARWAAHAASDAADASAGTGVRGHEVDPSTAFAAVRAISYAASVAEEAIRDGSAIWHEGMADANAAAQGKNIAATPLWSRGSPARIRDTWEQLQARLPKNEDWNVWIEWYEDRLRGSDRGEAHEMIFATVPLETWEQGYTAANKRIADELEKLAAKEQPPAIPKQGPGPHVEIDPETGAIVPAKPESLDAEGNNIARLSALHPQVVQLSRELVSLISQNEQPELHGSGSRYFENANHDLSEIDFDRLWGEGIFLEEAAVAAARRINDALREPLSDAALATLNALLKVHGPFILSSRSGLENLALANAYEVRPEEEKDRRAAAEELAEQFKANPDIVHPDETEMFEHFIEQPDSTLHPERSAAFKAGMAQNLTIVLTAGAAIGVTVASIAWAAGTIAAGAAGLAVLPLIEGLKKSKPFMEVAGLVSKGLDMLSEADARALWDRLSKIPFDRYRKFVLDNEDRLRRLLGDRKRARWLHEHLDWLRRVSAKE